MERHPEALLLGASVHIECSMYLHCRNHNTPHHTTHADSCACCTQVQTVDKYQGQQNDYILLSLVRTRAAGHLRDVRRLVVAMSRARLGLYVFGRQALFANCYELQPTFQQLLARPTQLALHPREYFQVGFLKRVVQG